MPAQLNDYGKLIVLVVGLLGGLAIVLVAVITHDQSATTVGVAIVGPIVGYVTGNGRLAARGDDPSPLISPTDPQRLPGRPELDP